MLRAICLLSPITARPLAAFVGVGLLAVTACAPTNPSTVDVTASSSTASQAIINGEDCTEEEYPTAMAIFVDATVEFRFGEQEIRSLVCTGTLIAPDVVLTAAHCLDLTALTLGFGEVTNERYLVSYEADIEQVDNDPTFAGGFPDDAVEAAGWVVHPDFDLAQLTPETVNGPGNFYDIGLIFLAEPQTEVVPAIVIAEDEEAAMVEQATVAIAGWGQQTAEGGSPFEPPPAGTVGYKICAESFINELGEYEMQIGGGNTTSRKCHGDSGGPTYLELDNGGSIPRRVIGVTSHAYDEEDCNKGGIDTRVDVWREWLDDQMQTACADGVRTWCGFPGVLTPDYVQEVLADGVPVNADYTGLVINELASSASPAWMELYNGSEHELPPSAVTWRVGIDGEVRSVPTGDLVAPGDFLRVELDATLAEGDEVWISTGEVDHDAVAVDGSLPAGCAIARVPDGDALLVTQGALTPGAPNGGQAIACGGDGGDGDGDGDGDTAMLLPGCTASHPMPNTAPPWSALMIGGLLLSFVRRRR